MSASARKSPRRTPHKQEAFSPARITRLEEKEELAELNQRLEHYIIHQRQRDASQGALERELEAVKENAAGEMENAKRIFNEQINALRRQRDEEAAARARAEADVQRLESELQNVSDESEAAKDDTARLQNENEELHATIAETESTARKVKEELNALRTQHNLLSKKFESNAAELERLREDADNAQSRAAEAESRANAMEEDLGVAEDKAEAELNRLRKLVEELTQNNARIEHQLRTEFANQLQELLDQRTQQLNEEKEEGYNLLKEAYDEKIRAYRDHLERAGHELEMLKAQKTKADEERREMKEKYDSFETIQIKLTRKIEELEEQVEEEQSRPNRDLADKNEIIRRLKASFKRKDEEFDQLMDVKIALAMEIKAYRQLLENEERRLGYASPSTKKRKRGLDDAGEFTGGVSAIDDESSLVISGMDTEGEYISVRNASTEPIDLAGWNLQSSQSEFKFPEMTLAVGKTVTVWTGEQAADKDDPPVTLAWEGEVWDPAGDEAVLVNPEGEVVHRVEIVPTAPDVAGKSRDVDLTGAENPPVNNEQQCHVM